MVRTKGIKRLKRTARRTMYAPAPDMRACTSLVTVEGRLDNVKPITRIREIYGNISFYLGGRPITIHGEMGLNQGGLCDDKPQRYLNKLDQLEHILVSALTHLESKDPTRFVMREFLNSVGDNNDYGSSVMIVIPEMKEEHLFCTLEIASCHFKSRQNPDRKELMKQIKFLLKGLRTHIKDYEEAIRVWS